MRDQPPKCLLHFATTTSRRSASLPPSPPPIRQVAAIICQLLRPNHHRLVPRQHAAVRHCHRSVRVQVASVRCAIALKMVSLEVFHGSKLALLYVSTSCSGSQGLVHLLFDLVVYLHCRCFEFWYVFFFVGISWFVNNSIKIDIYVYMYIYYSHSKQYSCCNF